MTKYNLINKLDKKALQNYDTIIFIHSNKLDYNTLTNTYSNLNVDKSDLNKKKQCNLGKISCLFCPEPKKNEKYDDLEDIRLSVSNSIKNIYDIKDKKILINLLDSGLYNNLKYDSKYNLNDITEAQIISAMSTLYTFDKYKSEENKKEIPKSVDFYSSNNSDDFKNKFKKYMIIGEHVNSVRDLGNEPGNKLTPVNYANMIKKKCKRIFS